MKIFLAIFAVSMLGLFSFQNCAQSDLNSSLGSNQLNLNDAHHGEAGFDCDSTGCHDFHAPKQETKYFTQIGNANYVASVFQEVFDEPKKPNEKISQILKDHIYKNRVFFGGKCHTHSDIERCVSDDNYNTNHAQIITQGYAYLSHRGGANSSREGYRMQTCDELIKIPSIKSTALSNAGVTVNSPFDWEHVGRLFSLFYPEIDDPYPVQKLGEISLELKASSKEDRWTQLLSVVCYSSGWQYY